MQARAMCDLGKVLLIQPYNRIPEEHTEGLVQNYCNFLYKMT